MAYDLEEQEQLDNIKAWWKQNGSLITWTLVVVLAAYVAWVTWTNHQGKQSAQASTLFEEVQMAVTTKENSKIQAVTETLTKDFSSSAYASMASFSAAKSSFEANDLKTAKKHLSWIVKYSKSAEYKAIARLRLAAIAIDEKAFDEGLKILTADFPAEFQGDVADRKGDIFYAQNKTNDAKTAYELALSKLSDKSPSKQLVQIKLDSLGGSNDQKEVANGTKK